MNILISGAGIAGPALAHWLTRQGHKVTVVERAPSPRQGGQAVDFRGRPQLKVLEAMGLLEKIRAAAETPAPITILNKAGTPVSTLPAEAFSGDVEILRGTLSEILREASTTNYVWNDTITALHDTGPAVTATFAKAKEETFDLVVGADGQNSTVRRLRWGKVPTQHLGMYGAIFSTEQRHPTPVMYTVPGRCITLTETRAALDFASPEIHIQDERAAIASAFAGMGWRTPELLEAMHQADDLYFSQATQIQAPTYSKGRTVLLGDAAHAPGPGGMGTGLAVVGAYILAEELSRQAVETALTTYEARMRPYVAVCQKQARGADRFLVPSKRTHIWMRNQIVRLVPPRLLNTSKAAEAISL
ncbi:FAD-dependent monooxygenase [Nonomuraea sp. NPDC050790]|uniref:FAD-dependent monooxygenase n=1 Tax=Nonomuraea sp. NPDC050790 TaxID=3364371 RepID=UPI00379BE934